MAGAAVQHRALAGKLSPARRVSGPRAVQLKRFKTTSRTKCLSSTILPYWWAVGRRWTTAFRESLFADRQPIVMRTAPIPLGHFKGTSTSDRSIFRASVVFVLSRGAVAPPDPTRPARRLKKGHETGVRRSCPESCFREAICAEELYAVERLARHGQVSSTNGVASFYAPPLSGLYSALTPEGTIWPPTLAELDKNLCDRGANVSAAVSI